MDDSRKDVTGMDAGEDNGGKENDAVQTGDSTEFSFWLILLAASCATVEYTRRKTEKKHRQ